MSARRIQQVLDNLYESIQEAGAEITHGELPTVRADASQLAQLLQNLLGNALKFRGEAPPKIHVDARREEDCWRFSVSDNGIGIDAQFQDAIFEIFRRLHTRKQYTGTGIGLAICKKIVDRHGGRVWVESQPGEGSTFFFTLPPAPTRDGHVGDHAAAKPAAQVAQVIVHRGLTPCPRGSEARRGPVKILLPLPRPG